MKNVKRLSALAMAGVMTLTMAGCGSSASSDSSADSSAASTEAATTEAAAETKSDVKIGFITLHDENSTYDLNFINAAKEACEEMGVEYVLKTNISEDNGCYEAACELAEECDIVFADSFGHEAYMIEAAQEYPDVQFCHATGTRAHTEGLDNYHNAFASIYEGRYLAGIAAGEKLNEMIANGEITEDEAKMGYVGAYTYAEVISGYTSFYLGAKSVCPSVTMDVTFTGSWYDETAEKEGAQKLIDEGCVLISQHADSMGAPTACEDAGVPDVTYNGSTEDACPGTYIAYSKVNWAPYFKYIIEQVENGEAIATDWTGTLATGSVEYGISETNCAEGTQEAIDEAVAALEAGDLQVFDTSTFTVEGAQLETYMADVDTDEAYEGDHEAIVDGAFQESADGFRSAPYFNVNIDGINLLDAAY